MEEYNSRGEYSSDCSNCFALCCVALQFQKSQDFPFSKKEGVPCKNLRTDFGCAIHNQLKANGFNGCTTYECFGAGQFISVELFNGRDWQTDPVSRKQMFQLLPVVRNIHEIIYHLRSSMAITKNKDTDKACEELIKDLEKIKKDPPAILAGFDIMPYRIISSRIFMEVSAAYRDNKAKYDFEPYGDWSGQNHASRDFSYQNFRGFLFIEMDLKDANLQFCDFLGTDMRNADISGADLRNSIFLTQSQINAAKGNAYTRIPDGLNVPAHWE
ncbi:Hypothetical protein Tpal_1658 [Trichococcus palustris]|uniref:Pentapeptide repeat-containing protein n=1 Tax=Trichococcus palustris TaxID=140314 RepID=A0A143YNQ6_9LACT|nr:pentapeptide repeat-containing protein [Trichococcus palustris]CZQ93614.1 Hypothetical protein Tpal_1658 [Trichococcus palustris]SFK83599.1 Pentapeptide repeat-containing protein [Trichococcus palustris]